VVGLSDLFLCGKSVIENAIYTPSGRTADNSTSNGFTDKCRTSNYDGRNFFVGRGGK
jgi:hypothetical protein